MTSYTKWTIALIVLMLTITGTVIWTIQDRFFQPDLLTIQQAAQKVEKLYGGTVESFEQKGNIFHMKLERNGIAYKLQMNPNNGDIIQFTKTDNTNFGAIKSTEEIRTLLMSQNEGTIESISLQGSGESARYVVSTLLNGTSKTIIVSATTGEIISDSVTQPNDSSSLITAEDAKQIVLSQIKGTVSSVTYQQSSEGGYYLVKILTNHSMATFQIHAISGKVLSVTHQAMDDDDIDEEPDEDDTNDDHGDYEDEDDDWDDD